MKRTTSLREIRESTVDELRARVSRLEGEIFKLKLKRATNQLEDQMQIRGIRREIARVHTILGEKARG